MKKHIKKLTISLFTALILIMGCATMSMAGTKCLVGSALHDCIQISEYTMVSGLPSGKNCNISGCTVTETKVRVVTQCTKCSEKFWFDKTIDVHSMH